MESGWPSTLLHTAVGAQEWFILSRRALIFWCFEYFDLYHVIVQKIWGFDRFIVAYPSIRQAFCTQILKNRPVRVMVEKPWNVWIESGAPGAGYLNGICKENPLHLEFLNYFFVFLAFLTLSASQSLGFSSCNFSTWNALQCNYRYLVKLVKAP